MKPQPTYPRKKNKLWQVPLFGVAILAVVIFIFSMSGGKEQTYHDEKFSRRIIIVNGGDTLFNKEYSEDLDMLIKMYEAKISADSNDIAFLHFHNNYQYQINKFQDSLTSFNISQRLIQYNKQHRQVFTKNIYYGNKTITQEIK